MSLSSMRTSISMCKKLKGQMAITFLRGGGIKKSLVIYYYFFFGNLLKKNGLKYFFTDTCKLLRTFLD